MTDPMTDRETPAIVLPAGKLLDLKARLDALDQQRICLRITDAYWAILKERARKSPKPLEVALQSELTRAAGAIKRHYSAFVLGK